MCMTFADEKIYNVGTVIDKGGGVMPAKNVQAAESKTNQAYSILRERIVGGQYVPGYRIVISDLARGSGISASPWREAIRRLQAEGWLEVIPNVGARVAEPGLNAHRQTFELLARLEGLATVLAVPQLNSDDMAALHRIDDDMRHCLDQGDDSRFTGLNREFHEYFYERCDFPRLNELIHSELERLEFIKMNVQFDSVGRSRRKPSSIDEHEHLLGLIEAHSPGDEIEDYARAHKLNALAYPHHLAD